MLLKSFSYISKPVGFMLNKLLIKQWREEQENTQVCHIFLFFPLLFYAELANLKKKSYPTKESNLFKHLSV